ncbi:MAG: PAS domain-containing sensor histidine kinase, partial [Zoogloea sp.]|nr:PAS domain-containing sensor histidine kinase [Zoogloea sp.]
MKIKAWLSLLILMATAPVIAFSCYTLYELADSRQEVLLVEMKQDAESSASAIRRRLDTVAATLDVLSRTDSALQQDHFRLHALALRVVKAHPDIQAITLDAPDGRQVFNTFRPFGSA